MEKILRKSVAPYYGAAAVWVLCALLLPLYTAGMFLLTAVLSVAAFLLLRAGCKDVEVPKPAPEKEKPKEPENPELQKMLSDGEMAIREMRRLNDAIADPTISAQIDHLESTTTKIISYVVEHPKKLPQIRKFLNYYLPTTLKLLNAYDRMGSAGVSGENIDGTMGKIEAMMSTVVQAFDRQLDALFGDEALDISTDITVLENLLAQEGLAGEQLGGQG